MKFTIKPVIEKTTRKNQNKSSIKDENDNTVIVVFKNPELAKRITELMNLGVLKLDV